MANVLENEFALDMDNLSVHIVRKNKASYKVQVGEFEIKIPQPPIVNTFKLLQDAYEYMASDVDIMEGSTEFLDEVLEQAMKLVAFAEKHATHPKIKEWYKALKVTAIKTIAEYDPEDYEDEEDSEEEENGGGHMEWLEQYVNEDYQHTRGEREPKPTIPCSFNTDKNFLSLKFFRSNESLANNWIGEKIETYGGYTILDKNFSVEGEYLNVEIKLDAEY